MAVFSSIRTQKGEGKQLRNGRLKIIVFSSTSRTSNFRKHPRGWRCWLFLARSIERLMGPIYKAFVELAMMSMIVRQTKKRLRQRSEKDRSAEQQKCESAANFQMCAQNFDLFDLWAYVSAADSWCAFWSCSMHCYVFCCSLIYVNAFVVHFDVFYCMLVYLYVFCDILKHLWCKLMCLLTFNCF